MSATGSGSGSGSAPRPRQVVLGGGGALAVCLLLVVSMFDAMSGVRSVEMSDGIRSFLATSPGNQLDLSVDDVIELLRGLVLLNGALAVTGAILAGYTLQRHRGARIGVSIIAVLMVFTASFVAGLLPVLLVVAAAMLWGRDARDWFAGRAPQPRPKPTPTTTPTTTVSPTPTPTPPAPGPVSPPMSSWPPPQVPPAPSAAPVAPGSSAQQPPPSPYAYGTAPAPTWVPPYVARAHAGATSSGRPVAVSVAAWLTWVFSGLTALACAILVLTLLTAQAELLSALRDNSEVAARNYSSEDLLSLLWVMASVGLFWSLAAIALAVLAFRRVRAGQVGLVVSSLAAAVIGVVLVVGVLNGLVALVSVILLLRGSTMRWYARSDGQPNGQSPGRSDS